MEGSSVVVVVVVVVVVCVCVCVLVTLLTPCCDFFVCGFFIEIQRYNSNCCAIIIL